MQEGRPVLTERPVIGRDLRASNDQNLRLVRPSGHHLPTVQMGIILACHRIAAHIASFVRRPNGPLEVSGRLAPVT
jgi:hypothetical protein